MAHDVFISYSSQDKPTADALCATLEANTIRCWIAPRDVVPGMNWAAAIIDAIHSSRVMVLVFSENSNRSTQVQREVERAAHRELPIIPFRIEDVVPSDAMEYFLGTPHWLDAMSPPLEQHLQQLLSTIRVLLSREESLHGPSPAPGPSPSPAPTPVPLPIPVPGRWIALLRRLNTNPYRWIVAGGGACFAVLAIVLVILALGRPTTRPLTPQQLYSALLSSPVDPKDLPSGISLVDISSLGVEANMAKHNAVGEVEVDLQSANTPQPPQGVLSAYVIYDLFPTEADALASLNEFSLAFTVPQLKETSKCFTGADTTGNTKYGYTACLVQSGATLAYAASQIVGDTQQAGNRNDTIALARFALAHLQAVEATAPSSISAAAPSTQAAAISPTARATSAPTTAPAAAPTVAITPVASLPRSISLVYEDLQSRSQATTADRDVRTVLAGFEASFGLNPTQTLTFHFFSDPTSAQQRMAQLNVDSDTIKSLLAGDVDAFCLTNGSAVDAIVYLPKTTDLQAGLAFCMSYYALSAHSGSDSSTDSFPYWFHRGFEADNEAHFTDAQFSQLPTAVQDAKAGTAPALSTISAYNDAQTFIKNQTDGSNHVDARGQAAVEYLSVRFGAAAIRKLLQAGPYSSIAQFNSNFQTVTGMSLSQFNGALDSWLRSS